MRDVKRIMLVEDDKDDQEFFVEALSEISNTTLHGIANDGFEALQHLSTTALLPDLIFMDINMPRMNGIECLKEILKLPHAQLIPVIMLSTSTAYIELIRGLGGRAFIEKPSEYGLLRIQLEKIVNKDFKMDTPNCFQHFTTITNESTLISYN